MTLGKAYSSAAAPSGPSVNVGGQSISNQTGIFKVFGISPIYNQTSTAGATDLLINRTETAIGSGAQYFQDWQVGGVSKAHLDHSGIPTFPNLAATASGDVSTCWTTAGSLTQGAVCGTSLLRDKDNIIPLEHGLDYLMQMQPVSYMRRINGKPEIGVIADWMAAIHPLLGTYNDKSGELANASDRAMIAVLIKAVQEQQAQIETLTAKVAALETRQ